VALPTSNRRARLKFQNPRPDSPRSPRKLIPRSRSRPPALNRLSERWTKMREVVQQATSSSSQLAAHGRTLGQAFPEADRAADLFRSRGRRLQRSGRGASRRHPGSGNVAPRMNCIRIGRGLSLDPVIDKQLQIVGLRIGRETLGLPISLVRENCARSRDSPLSRRTLLPTLKASSIFAWQDHRCHRSGKNVSAKLPSSAIRKAGFVVGIGRGLVGLLGEFRIGILEESRRQR